MQKRVPALGPRGEGWVALQVLLFALIAVAALLATAQQGPAPLKLRVIGSALCVAGVALIVWSAATLGSFLSVFPRPTERHELVTRGPFHWVRHPIYSGITLTALGACLISGSWLALAFSLCLCAVLDLKARREEAWLSERHPEYTAYRARTGKFVPGIQLRKGPQS